MNFIAKPTTMITTQTVHPPFDEIGLLEIHHKLVSQTIRWTDVGILIDQEPGEQKAVLILLIEKDVVVSVFRICFDTPQETLDGIRFFVKLVFDSRRYTKTQEQRQARDIAIPQKWRSAYKIKGLF